jgi:hypothetical protein
MTQASSASITVQVLHHGIDGTAHKKQFASGIYIAKADETFI